jgi:PKD repeat protein
LYDQSINGDHYYTQTLWSNGDADCEASPGSLLYPSPPPAVTASFTAPARAASGNAVSFDGSASTADSGGFSSATWSFGDGGSTFISSGSTGPASHTYAHPGTYTVSLTVVDTHGDVSTVSHQLSVGSPPAASFTATPAAAQTGQAIAFDGSASSDPNASTIASYAWNFGDGTTGTGVKPTHAYARVGTYTVSLVVTDALGFASPAVTKTIRIANPPVAVFSVPGSPVAGSSAAFDASGSSDPNGVILTNYAWSFGDGGSGTGVKPSHVYARPGTYTVTLTVTDADGLQSSHSATVTVAPAPRIVSVRGRRAGHSAVLLVKVSAPGTVRAGRHSARLRRAGTATIALTLSKAQRRALGHHHSVRVKVTIVYVPAVGPRITTKRTVTIKP